MHFIAQIGCKVTNKLRNNKSHLDHHVHKTQYLTTFNNIAVYFLQNYKEKSVKLLFPIINIMYYNTITSRTFILYAMTYNCLFVSKH